MMRSLRNKKIDVACAAVTFALMGLTGYGFVQRGRASAASVGVQRTELNAELNDLTALAIAMSKADEKLRGLEQQSERHAERLPAEMDFQSFYRAVTDFAERAGLELLDMTPTDPEQRAGVSVLPVQIELRGSFEAFHDFLANTTSLPRATGLARLEIMRGEDPSSNTIEMIIDLFAAADPEAEDA